MQWILNLDCADRTDGAKVQAAAVIALADFKNPLIQQLLLESTTGTTRLCQGIQIWVRCYGRNLFCRR